MAAKKIKLDSSELGWLCEQIALIQRSGILLPEGIELLAESADAPRLKAVLIRLSEQIGQLKPLSDAMEALGSFPSYLVSMVRVGEASGTLDQVLSGLADFYFRDSELKKKVRNALIYPIVLFFMMLAVIILLIVRVLPVFGEILASFGGTMPPFSQGLLSFGLFLARHAFWLVPALILIILCISLWLRLSPSGRRFLDHARLHLPITGPLHRRLYAARFSTSLHYLLRSGVDLDEALSMTESVMDNGIVSQKIAESREKIKKGEDLFTALQEMSLFPSLFVRMLSLGSQAGEMDVVMDKLARAYESEVNNRLGHLTSLVEPFLVIILSIIVGGILLTVMLPLVEIMSAIG